MEKENDKALAKKKDSSGARLVMYVKKRDKRVAKHVEAQAAEKAQAAKMAEAPAKQAQYDAERKRVNSDSRPRATKPLKRSSSELMRLFEDDGEYDDAPRRKARARARVAAAWPWRARPARRWRRATV